MAGATLEYRDENQMIPKNGEILTDAHIPPQLWEDLDNVGSRIRQGF